jgi:hypothetical protein
MKRICLAIMMIVPALLYGQSSLQGTWHTNMDQAKLSQKPYVFSVHDGMYDCTSCAPQITNVKADGTDQPVTGQTFDTLNVHVDGADSVTFVAKKDGKTMFTQTRTVSSDGKTLSLKSTSYPKNSTTEVQTTVTFSRASNANPGAHQASGSWTINRISENEAGLTTTYKMAGDELTMMQPTGESFAAKLDGKDYPFKGSYSFDTVSLKRIDDRTVEQTNKRGGKVISVHTITVAPDGKTMTEVVNNKLLDRTSTFVSEKQDFEAAK